MQAPTTIDTSRPNGAIALVFVDVESCGGPRQSLSGVRSVGFHVRSAADRRILFEHEWRIAPLAGIDCPFQKAAFWDAHPEQWNALNDHPLPRHEAIAAIRLFATEMRKLGWQLHLLARPAAYDFREITNLFETAGIDILSRRGDFLAQMMSPQAILEQACSSYDLSAPKPGHFDDRHMLNSPFGFGGASQVSDVGQQIVAVADMLGFSPPDFRRLLVKVNGAELEHTALQDARDQAAVWFAFQDGVAAFRKDGNRDVLAALFQ